MFFSFNGRFTSAEIPRSKSLALNSLDESEDIATIGNVFDAGTAFSLSKNPKNFSSG